MIGFKEIVIFTAAWSLLGIEAEDTPGEEFSVLQIEQGGLDSGFNGTEGTNRSEVGVGDEGNVLQVEPSLNPAAIQPDSLPGYEGPISNKDSGSEKASDIGASLAFESVNTDPDSSGAALSTSRGDASRSNGKELYSGVSEAFQKSNLTQTAEGEMASVRDGVVGTKLKWRKVASKSEINDTLEKPSTQRAVRIAAGSTKLGTLQTEVLDEEGEDQSGKGNGTMSAGAAGKKTGRELTGHYMVSGELPWAVVIEARPGVYSLGTLVGPRHVVTTASSIVSPTLQPFSSEIHMWTTSVERNETVPTPKVKKFHVHPKFKYESMEWNVAVIEMDEEVKLRGDPPVLYPSANASQRLELMENERVACRAASWGQLKKIQKEDRKLKSGLFQLIGLEECLKKMPKGADVKPKKGVHLCTKRDQRLSCTDTEEGAGLFCGQENTLWAVGARYNGSCGSAREPPALFLRADAAYDFVTSVVHGLKAPNSNLSESQLAMLTKSFNFSNHLLPLIYLYLITLIISSPRFNFIQYFYYI